MFPAWAHLGRLADHHVTHRGTATRHRQIARCRPVTVGQLASVHTLQPGTGPELGPPLGLTAVEGTASQA